MSNKKTIVLDTNILIQSPRSLFAFDDNDVVITESVVEELNNLKKGRDDKSFAARESIRILEDLRNKGDLLEGIELEGGGTFRIEKNHYDTSIPPNWDISKHDIRILQVCKHLNEIEGKDVRLITKDLAQRIRASIIKVKAEDYYNEQAPKIDKQYTGRINLFLNKSDINMLHNKKPVYLDELDIYDAENGKLIKDIELYHNQFLIFNEGMFDSTIRIYNAKENTVEPLKYLDYEPYKVKPRNLGQTLFIEALMRSTEEVPLVVAKGPAGTAKTFLSLAVALDKIFIKDIKKMNLDPEFRKVLICRPNILTEEIGTLPGDERDKIDPLMRPIYDNLEILIEGNISKDLSLNEIEIRSNRILSSNKLDMQSIGYLRGRSIYNQYIIIDEAQNLSIKQAKAIISRAGMGTKIVLIGDPHQIDHPYLDSRTNGLSYVSEKLKGKDLVMQLTFKEQEGVRSPLASLAAKYL